MRRMLLPLLLASCGAMPPSMPTPLAGAPPGSIDAALRTPSLHGLLASVDALPPTPGLARALHGRTACHPPGGVNPCVYLPERIPQAGRPLQFGWATRCGGDAPAEPCWLIVSFREPHPTDFTPFGMRGCWLLTNPDMIVPVPTEPGGMVQRVGGEVRFSWASPTAGTHFWAQLLVATAAGWLVSPGIEIIVGTAP